jgi:hypothetical protein
MWADREIFAVSFRLVVLAYGRRCLITPKEARASDFAETSLRNLDLSDSQRSDDFR